MTSQPPAADGANRDPIVFQFDRDAPSIYEVENYVEIQRAVMPVIGWTPSTMTPLGTCFCVCADPTILVSAWHVVDRWLSEHVQQVDAGLACVAALWETDEHLEDGSDLGGPLPVWRVVHEQGSELAFLLPFDQHSGSRKILPSAVAPIGFGVPEVADWCYSLGFPTLRGGPVETVGSRRRVDLTRRMSRAAGRVIEAFPDGQPGHAMVPGPAYQSNMPAPHGMSGGPVLTDGRAICGLVSSGLEGNEHHPEWATYVTLLAAGLDIGLIPEEDGRHLSLRDLEEGGAISVDHPLPAPRTNPGHVDIIETGYPLRI